MEDLQQRGDPFSQKALTPFCVFLWGGEGSGGRADLGSASLRATAARSVRSRDPAARARRSEGPLGPLCFGG